MSQTQTRRVRFEVSGMKPGVHPQVWNYQERHQYLHVYAFARFADVDGDGEPEALYLKGAFEQACYKLDGRRLWYYHDPGCPGFDPIREDSNCAVIDLDGDGVVEAACFRNLAGQTCLCLVNAANGQLIRATPIEPNPMTIDTRVSVIPARLDGPGGEWSLVVTRDYWRVEVYNSRLNLKFARPVLEMGHTVSLGDIDGSGRDWMFTGTHLFDPTGRLKWANTGVLLGTSETHPDSHFIADIDGDGKMELVVATGAHVLESDGRVRFARPELVPHAQSVRPLRHRGGVRMAYTAMPQADDAESYIDWRGRRLRNVRSRTTVLTADGGVFGVIDGVHTPQSGDWDGDGEDELFVRDADLRHINVWRQDGSLAARIAVQEALYSSDMVVAPVMPWPGEQLVTHEWDESEARCWCVIDGAPVGRHVPFDGVKMARWTCY